MQGLPFLGTAAGAAEEPALLQQVIEPFAAEVLVGGDPPMPSGPLWRLRDVVCAPGASVGVKPQLRALMARLCEGGPAEGQIGVREWQGAFGTLPPWLSSFLTPRRFRRSVAGPASPRRRPMALPRHLTGPSGGATSSRKPGPRIGFCSRPTSSTRASRSM